MRLHLVHQLTALLVAAVLLAVLLLSLAVAWNLRTGFSDYLRTRDQAELDRLAQKVAQLHADDPGLLRLRASRGSMKALIDELVPGLQSGPGPGPEPGTGPPGLRLHEPHSHVLQRAHIVDSQGLNIAGPPMPADTLRLRSALRIGGAVVAYAEVAQVPQLEPVDAQFLRRQLVGLGAVSLLTLALVGLSAMWVARRWSQPLRALQAAAQRMATGDFGVAMPSSQTVELAQLGEAMSRMAASLQTLEGARRRWLAQISHELRTPLTVLRGELEAIQEGVRSPTPELMTSLRDEALHLTRLVNDLHTLAIADLDGLPCSFDWGDAGGLIERAATRFAPLAAQAGLLLHVRPVSAAPIYWDFDRIAQLLGALLDNSLRYTQAPGRVEVFCTADASARVFRIEVSDSAPAVAAADIVHLFEPLFRSSRPVQNRARHGSGLGLAIAKAIVTAHAGQIEASLSPLGGLCVTVELPYEAQ